MQVKLGICSGNSPGYSCVRLGALMNTAKGTTSVNIMLVSSDFGTGIYRSGE
jgi:hypothetical protein